MYLRARRGSPDPADSTTSGRREAQAMLAFVLWDRLGLMGLVGQEKPSSNSRPGFHSAFRREPLACRGPL